MSPAVFAHGHLRLYLLSLLAERSMHGYELIQALSDRFGGTYVPSAGTIYPRLAKLEEEGFVTKEADGRKTVYAITDAGCAELEQRAGDPIRLFQQGEEEMFVGDLGMAGLARAILRGLQGILHFLCKAVDSHRGGKKLPQP